MRPIRLRTWLVVLSTALAPAGAEALALAEHDRPAHGAVARGTGAIHGIADGAPPQPDLEDAAGPPRAFGAERNTLAAAAAFLARTPAETPTEEDGGDPQARQASDPGAACVPTSPVESPDSDHVARCGADSSHSTGLPPPVR